MKMIKDGQEVYVDKDQIEPMLASGWKKILPLGMEEPVEDEVITDEVVGDEVITDEVVGDGVEDEVITDDVVDGEQSPEAAPRSIPRKKNK